MKRKNGGILGFVYYLKIKFFRIVVNIILNLFSYLENIVKCFFD